MANVVDQEVSLSPLMEFTRTRTSNHGSINDGSVPESSVEASTLSGRQNRNNNRIWLTLTVAVLLGLVSGTEYGFGRYARDLRDTLHLSQLQVQQFGILLDTGNYIGHPLAGYVYDRWGPRLSCISAALVVFGSYFSIHLSLLSPTPSLWIMHISFMGVGFGSGLGYIAGLGSTTGQFLSMPHYLGRAVALVAAGYGLSSTLVGISYHQMGGLSSFFAFWAYLVSIVNILGAVIFTGKERHHQHEEDGTSSSNTVEVSSEGDSEQVPDVPDSQYREASCNDRIIPDESNNDHEEKVLSENNQALHGTRLLLKWTTWRRSDFWLLFASFACITGGGLFVINNVSTMVQSIGENDGLTGTLVFLLSICNVFGRILMGFLADHPRVQKLDLYRYASLIMALALLLSAIGGKSRACLALTVTMAATAYGGSWVLIVGILADSYGKSHFGKDFGLMAMGPAVSGMIFNSLSAGLYQYHANDDSGICLGTNCYRGAYLITAASALIGFMILTRMQAQPSSY